jgi:hypothetical protein
LRNLLKIAVVLLILAALFKLQNNANMHSGVKNMVLKASSTQPFSPLSSENGSSFPHNQNNPKDLSRVEVFFLFLFLISFFSFSFNIFQFSSVRIWINNKIYCSFFVPHKIRNRAPPYFY